MWPIKVHYVNIDTVKPLKWNLNTILDNVQNNSHSTVTNI